MIEYDRRTKKIGERIKKGRKELKLSRPAFLEKLGRGPTSTKMLQAWEEGRRLPYLDDLAKMADLFDCDLGYLLGDYDCKRHIIEDIKSQTGLTENTIKNILEIKNGEFQELINKFLEDLTDYQLLPSLAVSYAKYKSAKEGSYYIFDENQKLIASIQDIPLLVLQNDFTMFLQSSNEYSKEASRKEFHKWTEEERIEFLAETQSDIQRGK